MLNAEIIKQKAIEYGAAAVGIADIACFDGVPAQRDPKQILPNARCVIGCAIRVPRALYTAMEQRKQFYQYAQTGVKYIDEDLSELLLLKLGGFIENEGYDACLQRNVSNLKIQGDHTTNPEVAGTYELVHAEPVAPGKPVPEIIMDFNFAAQMCGLGAVGRSGHLIAPKLGPFLRLVFIITDAPLECDAPFAGNLCDQCGACEAACPGHAIDAAGLDTWQCAVYYRGAHKSNPFQSPDFLAGHPNREAILEGTARFDSESAQAIYPQMDFLPSRRTGYVPCLCGKACDTACYHHLKEKGLL